MADCLRCGIEVSEYGRVCRDCIAVAPRYSAMLRESAAERIAAQRASDALLGGITYVGRGPSERTRNRRRSDARRAARG